MCMHIGDLSPFPNNNLFSFALIYASNIFSRSKYLEQEKLSTDWDIYFVLMLY